MTPRSEIETLIMRYLDGQLSSDEARRLSEHLRTNAGSRQWIHEIAAQAGAMGELSRVRELRELPGRPPAEAPARRRLQWRQWGTLAALILLGFGLVFATQWWSSRDARPAVEVVSVVGELGWTGPTGQRQARLPVGRWLRTGTFETAGEGALAQLRFSDGTTVTLGANTRVAIADRPQKRIVLFTGGMSAEVTLQPKGRPMMVETPTALLEVLGTVFVVSADSSHTTLNVDQGRVRLRRIADGGTVDVPARHGVRASFETDEQLIPEPVEMPPSRWRLDPAAGLMEGIKAEWSPASDVTPAHFEAVPLLQGTRAGQPPIIHHGLGVRQPWQPNSGSFVTIAPTTVMRLTYRMKHDATLILFVVTQRPGGRFGGNFEYKHREGNVPADADGWVTLTVPLASFVPILVNHADYPVGNGVSYVSVRTLSPEPRLEVRELAIETPP